MTSKKVLWLVAILFILLGAYFKIRYAVFTVPQSGMAPSILPKERFIIDKYAYRNSSDLEYGDIIVFRDKTQKHLYVWRVVGKPGDSVKIGNGIPIVNGVPPLREEVTCDLTIDYDGYQCFKETLFNKSYEIALKPILDDSNQSVAMDMEFISVPEDSVFLLGDCRNCAADSREQGFVNFSQIIGKAIMFLSGHIHVLGDSL